MDRKFFSAAVALATGAFVSGGAEAQGLTDTEIAARFAAQREAIRAVAANPALGPSRGLVLTNIEPSGGRARRDGGGAGAARFGDGRRAAGAAARGGGRDRGSRARRARAPGAADAAPETPVTANWTLPKDDQVNVQVTFDFDSAVLADSQKPMLRNVCSALEKAGVGVLRIVGHTDAAGSAGYNQKLSVLRAEEVERFFVTDCRVPADRLQAVGVGEQFPYDDSNPRAGVNRRVEFQAIS